MDGVGDNSQDFDLRVTAASDTLEYDDARPANAGAASNGMPRVAGACP